METAAEEREPLTSARDLAAAFIERLERRDWDGFAALLHPDVVYEMPQSRERIRGRDAYLQFNREYPGDWHLEPEVVLGGERDAAVLFRWRLGDDEDSQAIVFFQVDGDAITRVTDFWPEPYDPPPGREHLVERW